MGTTAGGPFPAGVGAAPATRARPQAAAPAAASRGGRQAVPGPSLYELYSEEELLALAVQLSLQDANGGAPVATAAAAAAAQPQATAAGPPETSLI